MEGPSPDRAAPSRPPLESVRCLSCGAAYSKPTGGGTVLANPGCPRCGYVGWLSDVLPLRPPPARTRSDADRQLRRVARSR